MCFGFAFSGVRCPLGLACVWPRALVLHGAVGRWKLAWLWAHSSWRYFCSSVTPVQLSHVFSGLGSVCPCPSPRAVLPLFQVPKAHLFCGARSLMVKHKQLSVSIPLFHSYPPTRLIYPHVPPCTVQDCHSTDAGARLIACVSRRVSSFASDFLQELHISTRSQTVHVGGAGLAHPCSVPYPSCGDVCLEVKDRASAD